MDRYLEKYNSLNSNDELTTTLIFNGEKLKVQPTNNRVVFPLKYDDLIFNPKTAKFILNLDFQDEKKKLVDTDYNFKKERH